MNTIQSWLTIVAVWVLLSLGVGLVWGGLNYLADRVQHHHWRSR